MRETTRARASSGAVRPRHQALLLQAGQHLRRGGLADAQRRGQAALALARRDLQSEEGGGLGGGEVRRATGELGFVAVRVVPRLWDLPPDDRRYYPVYAACVEAGVPFCTQIGHTGPLCPSEPGRLIPHLDRVLLDFSELVVVGGHVGFPWVDEVVSLAAKYPGIHVDTSAYATSRLPAPFVEWMRGRGRERDLFLGGSARRVFRLM